jgi:hypothetical protein
MNFEWDPGKRSLNLLKHGLDFVRAGEVFQGVVRITLDNRLDYGETRYRCMGLLDNRVVMIAYTTRSETIRIISMRKANDREKEIYEKRPETP